jgi:hypothetical protein
MDSLKKLINESAMFSEETKAVLIAEVEAHEAEHETKVAEAVEATRKETLELVSDTIAESGKDILGDYAVIIAEAQTQEVAYELKLQQFKDDYDQTKQAEIAESIELAVSEEIAKISESVEEFKKFSVVSKLAESYADAASVMFGGETDSELAKLRESKKELDELKCKTKIDECLSVFGKGTKAYDIGASILSECTSPEKVETKFAVLKYSLAGLNESVEPEAGKEQLDESDKGEKQEPEGTAVLENVEPEGKSQGSSVTLTEADKRLTHSLSRINR